MEHRINGSEQMQNTAEDGSGNGAGSAAALSGEARESDERDMRRIRASERRVRDYQERALHVLLLLGIIWALFFRVIGVTAMPGGGMAPRIDAGDLLLFYRLDTDVRDRDVIVIEKAAETGAPPSLFVARVAAVGGDVVEVLDDGRLTVNGNAKPEKNSTDSDLGIEGFLEYPLTLEEDECFVLSDSRDGGLDSRYFGPVNESEIVGTVFTIVRRNNL